MNRKYRVLLLLHSVNPLPTSTDRPHQNFNEEYAVSTEKLNRIVWLDVFEIPKAGNSHHCRCKPGENIHSSYLKNPYRATSRFSIHRTNLVHDPSVDGVRGCGEARARQGSLLPRCHTASHSCRSQSSVTSIHILRITFSNRAHSIVVAVKMLFDAQASVRSAAMSDPLTTISPAVAPSTRRTRH